jgi:hypothetical protein
MPGPCHRQLLLCPLTWLILSIDVCVLQPVKGQVAGLDVPGPFLHLSHLHNVTDCDHLYILCISCSWPILRLGAGGAWAVSARVSSAHMDVPGPLLQVFQLHNLTDRDR